MKLAHDLYAEANPAFCAYATVGFVKAYFDGRAIGPGLPLIYIALPLAMSGELGSTFRGTNRQTGLREWLRRSPQVQMDIAQRLNASMDIVSEAIRFACFSRVVALQPGATLALGERPLKKSPVSALSVPSAEVMKHAERLGYWFADAGSSRNIFDIFGITV